MVHGFRHRDMRQHVSLIIVMDAKPAPGQLFRHDGGTGHEQHRHTIRNHAYQHQGKHRVVIARDLKRKNDEGEGGSRGCPENCSHSYQGERAGCQVCGWEYSAMSMAYPPPSAALDMNMG